MPCAGLQVLPLQRKLRGLGHQVVRVVLALVQPRREPLLPAAVEKRCLSQPLQGAHRRLDPDGAQHLEVGVKGAHECRLARHHLRVPSLEGRVLFGQLLGKAAQVGDGGGERGRLHVLREEQLTCRLEPAAAALAQRRGLQEVQAEAPLVVEERTHEGRGDALELHAPRQVVLGERLGHLHFGGRWAALLGRDGRARERPPVEEEYGTGRGVQIGEHVLCKRLLVLQLVSIHEEDLVGGRHPRRHLHGLFQSMHGVMLGHGQTVAKPGLGLCHQHAVGAFRLLHEAAEAAGRMIATPAPEAPCWQ